MEEEEDGQARGQSVCRLAGGQSAGRLARSRSAGRLVVCPTPIGNLGDVTLRVLEALRSADVVACEDTRRTAGLLRRHGIEARLVSYSEHNEARRVPQLIERIVEGQVVAIASDAGMPAISDPGFTLIRACLDAELDVEVLPGPSAVTAALVASGIRAPTWRFVGFLPRKPSELESLLQGLDTVAVAFEAPPRLVSTLEVIARADSAREVAVVREMTKLHGEVVRGAASEVAASFRDRASVRGEVTLVVGAPRRAGGPSREIVEAGRRLVEAGARRRTVAATLARLSGPGIGARSLFDAIGAGRGGTGSAGGPGTGSAGGDADDRGDERDG